MTTTDPEFLEALSERATAIGAVVLDRFDNPTEVVATYWALLGLAAAAMGYIHRDDCKGHSTDELRTIANDAMEIQIGRWRSEKN